MTNDILYTVAVTFTNDGDVDRWLRWLRDGHLADVLAGGALRAALVELDGTPRTFEVRYVFADRAAFDAYERDHAPRLREEGLRLFPIENGISYRRTVGTLIDVREGGS